MAKLSDSALNIIVEAVEKISYGSVTISINGDHSSDISIEISESLRVKKGSAGDCHTKFQDVQHEG